MRVGVTGSSGLVGRAVCARLGEQAVPIVRDRARPGVLWDPAGGEIDATGLAGLDAVVHLAGENLGEGRWTDAKKARVVASRVDATALLARALAGRGRGPRVLVCASAIGFYGDAGDRACDETAPRGDGFLAELVDRWEAAAAPARDAGVRVVSTRFGLVLSKEGGALGKMLPLFRAGLGGRLGRGTQWMSWIAMDDVLGAIEHALARADLSGPVNVVAPEPVTNADFTRALARAVHRPAFLPAPAFALRLALGTAAADEMVLASTRVVPRRLVETGYAFVHPSLDGALAAALA